MVHIYYFLCTVSWIYNLELTQLSVPKCKTSVYLIIDFFLVVEERPVVIGDLTESVVTSDSIDTDPETLEAAYRQHETQYLDRITRHGTV